MKKQKETGTTLLTRVMFCQKCFDNKMPQKGQLFLTIGRGRQKFEVHMVTKNGHFGYTPHIIEKIETTGQGVRFMSSCSIHNCDAVIEQDENTGKYSIALSQGDITTIPIRDWNSLVLYTNDSDYTLD